jgi:predicted O-linked N-acetylglucosamine transferase (SPINDLY family)
VRRLLLERLASWGIDPARVDLSGGTSSRREHLERYAGLDVALDTFPYHGTTTTCEALWMGVPVVTLAGRAHASRVGVSLLTVAGLPELITRDPEEYIRVAAELASDRDRLARLRAGLRDRLRASALCDAPGYARRVEQTLREIWVSRCAAGR